MSAGSNATAVVGIVMGSNSDWDVMQHAAQMLDQFGVPYEAQVLSAHRMPDDMFAYAEAARSRGLRAIIAGAGGAAHLPGMLASKTLVPVFGVPVPSKYLRGEGLFVFDCANAQGHSGSYLCDWRGGRCQCSFACHCDIGCARCQFNESP